MNLDEKLSERRRALQMTQEEVAEKLGITPQAVSKWENGAACPDISLLPTIAKLYGTSIDELLSDEPLGTVEYLPQEKRKNFNDMVFRILVNDDGDKIKVNIPMPLVKLVLESGMKPEHWNSQLGKADLSGIDFAALVTMVENGVIGRLVEIEESGGTNIVIEVV